MRYLKSAIDPIRANRWVSLCARVIARPLRATSGFVASEIAKKVWINGATVEFGGTTLTFPPGVGLGYASSIYWSGDDGFEPLNWNVLRTLLQGRPRHFFDIGSNIGMYSVLAQKHDSELIVHAFEPVPSIYAMNRLFHRANGFVAGETNRSPRLFQKAVSDSNGTALLHLPVSSTGAEAESTGTIRPDSWQAARPNASVGGRSEYKAEIIVETVTLDSYCRDNDIRGATLIKIDVEDHEAAVLQGARQMLAAIRPLIVCEMLPREHGNQLTFQILESAGYSVFGITDGGIFRCSASDLFAERTFRDCLCVPSEALARLSLSGRHLLSTRDLEALAKSGPTR